MAKIVKEQDKMLGTGRSYSIQYLDANHILIEYDMSKGSLTETEHETLMNDLHEARADAVAENPEKYGNLYNEDGTKIKNDE